MSGWECGLFTETELAVGWWRVLLSTEATTKRTILDVLDLDLSTDLTRIANTYGILIKCGTDICARLSVVYD